MQISIDPRFYSLENKTAVTSFGQGFLEFITNAIDAYDRTDHNLQITILYDIEKRVMSVEDNSRGMTLQNMKDCLLVVGSYTSYGENSRGMMGRGAKDVSNLGRLVYVSKKDLEVSSCYISKNMECGILSEINSSDIPENNGTKVTIHFHPEIILPSHDTMKTLLKKDFSIRKILTNDSVTINFNGSVVKYDYPTAKKVLDSTFRVIWKDFEHEEDAPLASFKIWVTDKPIMNPSTERCRENGIMILSDFKSVYELGYLEYEGGINDLKYNRYSKYVYGEIECKYLDTLIRQHTIPGSTPELGNNFLILDPGRKSLSKSHPFIKALFSVPSQLYQMTIARVYDFKGVESFTSIDIDSLFGDLAESLSSELVQEKTIYTWRSKDDQRKLENTRPILDTAVYDNDFYKFPENTHKGEVSDRIYTRKIKISLIDDPELIEPYEIIQLPYSIEIKINVADCSISCLDPDLKTKLIGGEKVPKAALSGIASVIRVAMTKIMTRQEIIENDDIDSSDGVLIENLNKLSVIENEINGKLGKKIYYSLYRSHIRGCESCMIKYASFLE